MFVNKTRQNESKAFDILCNIVDAYHMRDKKLIHRRVMMAVTFLDRKTEAERVIEKSIKKGRGRACQIGL